MRRLIIILLFLCVSVWFGLEILQHPGYLLLVYQPWMVQMPLWFALVSLLAVLGFFYVLIASIDQLYLWAYQLKSWWHLRKEQRLYSKTQQGMSALIEGRFKKAERFLLAGVQQGLEPVMNYLGAARAAAAEKAYERADTYIKTAYQVAPHAEMAIGLTQAELELEQGHLEHAAATLTWLKQQSPRHPKVLQLLEKTYVRLGDWKQLAALLPNIRKAKFLKTEDMEHLEKNVYREMLKACTQKDLKELQKMWGDFPRYIRKNPDVICEYVKQLRRFSDTKEIESLIRSTLKKYWQSELVEIYGTLPFSNVNRQLVIAGAWLKIYGQQQAILLLLARLCVRAKLWGKAKDYFEKCLVLGPNTQASLEYGRLLEQLGDAGSALQKYREGLWT